MSSIRSVIFVLLCVATLVSAADKFPCRMLISDHSKSNVLILAKDGSIEWQMHAQWVLDAQIRETGSVIITAPKKVWEVIPDFDKKSDGKILCEYEVAAEADSAIPLANGHTLICNWGTAYDGKKPQMFEITPEKRVVWQLIHPDIKSVTTVQVLTAR